MSKVDWSKAPEGAEFYAVEKFRAEKAGANPIFWNSKIDEWDSGLYAMDECMESEDFERNPDPRSQWPSESRIDIIGTNGNTGESYVHYDEFREKCTTGPSVYDNVPIGKMREAVEVQEKEREQQAFLGMIGGNKYQRGIVGLDGTKTTVDVYRVLDAFKTDSAAIDHAIKKLLAPGLRHSKDRKQDLQEAIDSIAAELLLMSQK